LGTLVKWGPPVHRRAKRLLANAIVQQLTLTSSGAFELATENSTKPIIERHHAGIVPTRRFCFVLP